MQSKFVALVVCSLYSLGGLGCASLQEMPNPIDLLFPDETSVDPQEGSKTYPDFHRIRPRTLGIIVHDHSNGRMSKGHLNEVEGIVGMELAQRGYRVREYTNENFVQEELKYSAQEITADNLVELGQLIPADAILFVSINQVSAKKETREESGLPFWRDKKDREADKEKVTVYVTEVALGMELVGVQSGTMLWNRPRAMSEGERKESGIDWNVLRETAKKSVEGLPECPTKAPVG